MVGFAEIRKRDGRVVPYDRSRIVEAIYKAIRAVGSGNRGLADELALRVEKCLQDGYPPNGLSVELVQDMVEKVLIEAGQAQVAKAYILYRQKHAELRDTRALVADTVSLFDDYIKETDWRVKENSNMTFSLQGLNNHIISNLTSRYWLHKIYSQRVREAHENGDLHIHDLGILAPYCAGWDLGAFLRDGFRGATGKIQSAPPKHLRSALGQLVNLFYTLQGEAAGAQAVSSFDTYLAPFVRRDGLSYAEVKQAIQEFVFNLNIPTRVGFQTPFTNLTLDVAAGQSAIADEYVLVSGEYGENRYRDYQPEMDMINLAFCEVMLAGDAAGRAFSFPIPTYNITRGFDWDTPVADKIMELTAKYGTPYFANFMNSDMDPRDVRSMCCRLRLDTSKLEKRGGLFTANPLTGSIGVVTLNMARIGYLSKTEAEFLDRVGRQMEVAKESLVTKRAILERLTDDDLYPYSRFYLRDIKRRFGTYWKNHFSTIGLVGMNEALLNLLGCSIADLEGQSFARKVMRFMKERLLAYQAETGDNWNLEASPAEGASYRLARLDKKAYPEIITAGHDEPYYTNSTQLNVAYTQDVFEALELQEPLQSEYTGGTVFHGFLGECIDDIGALKHLLQRVLTNFSIPYFTITPTFSVCPDHGYIAGEQFTCPACGRETEVWSRVVGYFRPVQNWNAGKREEFKNRREFVSP
ncbi:MAG: ribonucleoside triphosphate reductase [Bacillota bacterium]